MGGWHTRNVTNHIGELISTRARARAHLINRRWQSFICVRSVVDQLGKTNISRVLEHAQTHTRTGTPTRKRSEH